MRNSALPSYSQVFLLKTAFEHELSNVLRFEDRQEYFRVINYFEERIAELKEDEKECLKAQIS